MVIEEKKMYLITLTKHAPVSDKINNYDKEN